MVRLNVAILIATFGDNSWKTLAAERAMPSALSQNPTRGVHWQHGNRLHETRNQLAYKADADWLVFLDADDQLAPGYLNALENASGDLRAPWIQFVNGTELTDPISLADRDINHRNPCVIGTMIRREMFLDLGGFWDERAWEDWSLFRRAYLTGASVEHVEGAVYRIHEKADSRNNTVVEPEKLMYDIRRSHAEWLRRRQ